MILLIFAQGEIEMEIAVFDTEKEKTEFLELIPGYECKKEQIEDSCYTYETIDPNFLSEYSEICYKGNTIPLTKFMFSYRENISVYWKEIPNLSKPDQGFIQGMTKVDAYMIPNSEVKGYIQDREEGYQRVAAILHRLHYMVSRNYDGSEDGEVIFYQKKGEKEPYILTYLDFEFVEFSKKLKEEEIEERVLSIVE